MKERIQKLEALESFQKDFPKGSPLSAFYASAEEKERLAIASVFSLGQGPNVFHGVDAASIQSKAFRSLMRMLTHLEVFYREIGGIIGYHQTLMRLVKEQQNVKRSGNKTFRQPPNYNISGSDPKHATYVRQGIETLPKLAEIYPVGGAGDRLNLVEEKTGIPLPAAQLKFLGRTLLEGMIRDLQAREYLHEVLTGKSIITPIALMTSEEKGNTSHIREICEDNQWFGRPKESFFLFKQPLVPVICEDGTWSMRAALKPTLKPGGHGVIWKLMEGEGVFSWLENQGRKKALLRQINNPVAGCDDGLLAFCGIGMVEDKQFGFAACKRRVHTAEGTLVLVEEEGQYRLSNIEYTDFAKEGLEDAPEDPGGDFSKYPSNTNLLFVDLSKVPELLSVTPIPGMLANFKNKMPTIQGEKKRGGRLESMMQSLSDAIIAEKVEALSVFTTQNVREKTISVTKRAFSGEGSISETPEGCYYRVLTNNEQLLRERCGFTLPKHCSESEYLKQGPNLLFLYHPALGPLYSVIAQKVRGGSIADGGELQLEIAHLSMENSAIEGSLCIEATMPLGKNGGRCWLRNIRVQNRGIDRASTTDYWKNAIVRHEACRIVIHGDGEFVAEDVTFSGDFTIEVPAGYRYTATENSGVIEIKKEKIVEPSWEWNYAFDGDNQVVLEQCITPSMSKV